MAPVAKVKTAFLFFQTEMIGVIKNDLGPGASMGAAMTEVSIVKHSTAHVYGAYHYTQSFSYSCLKGGSPCLKSKKCHTFN
jgi:hypothetical protein